MSPDGGAPRPIPLGPQTISIAAAIDESFVTPLLVMLRSAARRLSAGWTIEAFVFGYEIPAEARQRLESGMGELPVTIHWPVLDLSTVANYWPGIWRKHDVVCYYRLFLGDALAGDLDRVLFLDADLLVQDDLALLWSIPFDGATVQAVPDSYACHHTARLSQIQFGEGVRFSAGTPYFNAGVQLIDLRRWRDERVGQRAAAFLWKYGEQLRGRDQDALNCALAGRWKRLPPAWNFHELAYNPQDWESPGATEEEVRDALRHPSIIHYIGWKPWSRVWRSHRADLWWAEARAAGLKDTGRIRHVAVWDAVFWGPHSRLEWLSYRGNWSAFGRLMLSRPWTALTYPVWRLKRR